MLNLSSTFDYTAKQEPDKTAIIFGEKRFTFSQIAAAVNQIANALTQAEIGKGDNVALSCPNIPFFPMMYYAILKTGATVVPLNVLLKGREIAYHLNDSKAKAYFCFQGTPELPMALEGYEGFCETDSCKLFRVINYPRA